MKIGSPEHLAYIAAEQQRKRRSHEKWLKAMFLETDGAWYDPRDFTTLLEERTGDAASTRSSPDGVVGTMLDKSGNSRHALASADAARPTLKYSGDFRYLDCDGANHFMQAGGLDLGAVWTHVGVWKFDTAGDHAFGITTAATGGLKYASSVLNWRNSADSGDQAISSSDPGAKAIVTIEFTAADTVRCRVNGTTEASETVNSTTGSGGLGLFSSKNDALDAGFDGQFYGGVWLARAVDEYQRRFLEQWAGLL